MSQQSAGVYEIIKRYDTDTYRAVYAVKIGETVYVLHAFQKKSKRGIKTPQADVDLIKQRYKDALEKEEQL
jgi:phage-related protein